MELQNSSFIKKKFNGKIMVWFGLVLKARSIRNTEKQYQGYPEFRTI